MLRLPYPSRRGNAPGFKGVRKCRTNFTAQVHRGGRRFHLGTFPNEHHAAVAVNVALTILYPDLPSRFLNDLPAECIPDLVAQAAIRQEVLLRLGPYASRT